MTRKPRTRNAAKPRSPNLGDELIRGLSGFRDALEEGAAIGERFTMRSVRLELEPPDYSPDDIRALRHHLRSSQAVFAKLVGVSVKTVQAWEQGSPAPAIARRLFDLMERDLSLWEELLQASASPQRTRRPA